MFGMIAAFMAFAWYRDIMKKLRVTWSITILSKRVRNYNFMVLNRDNTKLKKYN